MDLEEKLAQWQREGLLNEATVERIVAYEKKQPQKRKVPLLLIIGLVFFSLAVFSFIAANWQAIPDILKVTLVVLLMWLFYALAYLADQKYWGSPTAFRMLGLAMFGASILVALQTFHFSMSNFVLPWTLFLAALAHYFYWRHVAYAVVAFVFGLQVLTSSVPTTDWFEWGLFIAVSLAWFYFSKTTVPTVFSWLLMFGAGLQLWSLVEYNSPLWPVWTLFFLVLLLLLVPEKERPLRPLYLTVGAVQLVVYLAVRGETELSLVDVNLLEATALALAGAGIGMLCYIKFRPLAWISVLGAIGFLLFDDSAIGLAIVTELTALAYLVVTQRQNQPLTPGFLYFIVIQFVIYIMYAWKRLDMSLFFLIGALLLFALSGIGWWMNRRKGDSVS